jgi:hypothetical protein
LIVAKGLLDAGRLDLTNKEKAYRLGAAVWYDYRRVALRQNSNVFGDFEETICDLPGFIRLAPTPALIQDVPIEAVTVWDTVGSLGIPEYTRQMTCIDVFRFADTVLSAKVKHGIHAIALDEQRANFTPTLWDTDPRIVQVLFPGAHADVGGGYPQMNDESGLSDGALDWMFGQLVAAPLLLKFLSPLVMPPAPNAAGTAHQPWRSPPWIGLPTGPRAFSAQAGLLRDPSIDQRRQHGPVRADPAAAPAPYDPKNLP